MAEITSLGGRVELYKGRLALCIPLDVGGDRFLHCTRGIGEVDGDHLIVVIQQWLADKLGVAEGSLVQVDNENGKFNIRAQPEE